jgi:hypothetical protein
MLTHFFNFPKKDLILSMPCSVVKTGSFRMFTVLKLFLAVKSEYDFNI